MIGLAKTLWLEFVLAEDMTVYVAATITTVNPLSEGALTCQGPLRSLSPPVPHSDG